MPKGLKDIVGRPVISNCGTATEYISEYLNFNLNPFVSKSKSYDKGTNHFQSLLAQLGEIPDDAVRLNDKTIWINNMKREIKI